jgi:glycosyltransferase involved in cell wall biosynthesis
LDPGLDAAFPRIEAPKDAMLRAAWSYRRLLRAWRPDLLVTCNWGAIEFALANLLPVARHVHVVDGFGPEEREATIPRRDLIRRIALRRDTVVVPSRVLERIAVRDWGLDPARVLYLPNGIDLGRFDVPRAPKPQGAPVSIGTVAGLRPEKNIGRLIRAFATLPPSARLTIVGDGPERAGLEALAGALGISDRVRFAGQRDDTHAFYADFDVFALPSDTEQMPLSLLEAMAAGLPAAATDVGDVRTMAAEANAPFVVPKDDAAFARALAALASDPGLRAAVGAANRDKALREFGQERMFAAWRAVWTGA